MKKMKFLLMDKITFYITQFLFYKNTKNIKEVLKMLQKLEKRLVNKTPTFQ